MTPAITGVITVLALLSLGLYIQMKIQSRIIEILENSSKEDAETDLSKAVAELQSDIDILYKKQHSDYKVIKDLEHRVSVLEAINENKG